MDAVMRFCAVLGAGVICFFILSCLGWLITTVKEKTSNKKSDKTKKRKRYVTVTKRKLNQILNHAITWVYLSFILAFLGKEQIAENISVQAIITIIGAFAAYCLKSYFEKRIGKEKEEYENVSEEDFQ